MDTPAMTSGPMTAPLLARHGYGHARFPASSTPAMMFSAMRIVVAAGYICLQNHRMLIALLL